MPEDKINKTICIKTLPKLEYVIALWEKKMVMLIIFTQTFE